MIEKTEIIDQPGFFIAGLSVRTTNQNGQSQKDIGDLWTRVMNGNILQSIGNKTSGDTYCVYTDYESDHTGFYTALIGCSVGSLDNIPAGLTGLTIARGKYKIYSLAGEFPQNVHEAWVEIWNSGIERAYTADFDLYSGNVKSFDETKAKIYLAIK
jgi:predicted transcriptional regulator YdeE